MHVGEPKFRLPTSENACPVIFLNFVQRTTSQGSWGTSGSESKVAGDNRLVREDFREWICVRKGDDGRMLPGDEDSLDWNRRSKGRCDGLGLGRGEEPRNASALLLGDD